VDVDADPRRAASDAHGEVRALRSDAAERRQNIDVARQLAPELVLGAAGDLPDLRSLCLMKAASPDQRVDLRHRQLRHGGRRGRALEKFDGGRKTDLVASADGDDAPDKLLEDASEAALRELEHGRVRVLRHRRADMAQNDIDIEGQLARHAQIKRSRRPAR
jgi:hypothetical protein